MVNKAVSLSQLSPASWRLGGQGGESERQGEEARLVGEIRRIHARSGGTYGVPRVHAELRRGGWMVNHKRVERLMRTHDIAGWRPPGADR
jgi:HTH-like domain